MINKVTKKDVQENMQDIIVKTEGEFGKPVTYVTVKMKNGFTLRESTTCVDPANYNEEIGAKICLEKIEDKIWMLLGFQLQDKMSKYNNKPKSSEEQCNGCEFEGKCQLPNDENESIGKKLIDIYKENVARLFDEDDDDEAENNEGDETDGDYVHLSVSMSPKVFKDLLDHTMIL